MRMTFRKALNFETNSEGKNEGCNDERMSGRKSTRRKNTGRRYVITKERKDEK